MKRNHPMKGSIVAYVAMPDPLSVKNGKRKKNLINCFNYSPYLHLVVFRLHKARGRGWVVPTRHVISIFQDCWPTSLVLLSLSIENFPDWYGYNGHKALSPLSNCFVNIITKCPFTVKGYCEGRVFFRLKLDSQSRLKYVGKKLTNFTISTENREDSSSNCINQLLHLTIKANSHCSNANLRGNYSLELHWWCAKWEWVVVDVTAKFFFSLHVAKSNASEHNRRIHSDVSMTQLLLSPARRKIQTK